MALNQNQTRELQRLIERRREALVAELREDAARTREHPYLEQADLTRDLEEFRALEAARQRLKDGGYGICIDCGTDIDFPRLKAFPAAPRCIQCQERYEKTYRGEPKPSL